METPEYLQISTKYPHIAKKIVLLWGSYDMDEYFRNLLFDTRNVTREGFPVKDALCICELYKIHKQKFPEIECKLNIKI